jgi:4-amino-4-deoxy-L-arabinose transferase-like glycosyltransferase
MNKIKAFLSSQKSYAIIFWVMILIRGIFNYEIPLTDNTEARYAEIARIMSETQNWITLQIDYGIPFWAKPPLSTWASALSISIFGNHEFFVRLPFLMLAIILVFSLGHHKNKSSRYLPGIILLSLPEFYLHAGVVSTDMFLSFSIALIMLSFWEAIKIKTNLIGDIFFLWVWH